MSEGDQNSIGNLAAALAAAQGAIKGAAKDKTNPHFKSQYADLTAVWDACREALSKNKIAVIQAPEVYEGKLILHTTLAHSSGEQISGTFPVTPVQNTPQGIGSAMTYARRYSLASMVGVAPEGDDDDGNAGSAGTPTNGATKDTSPPAQVKEKARPRIVEPAPAQQARVLPKIEARIEEIGHMGIDQLFALEDDAEYKQQLEWLHEHWPQKYNDIHGYWKERVAALAPANGD